MTADPSTPLHLGDPVIETGESGMRGERGVVVASASRPGELAVLWTGSDRLPPGLQTGITHGTRIDVDALRAQRDAARATLRRYEPQPGDRVTVENVAGVPIGQRVTWTRGDGSAAFATKRGPDDWRLDGFTFGMGDRVIAGDPPTFILSIPAEQEAPRGE